MFPIPWNFPFRKKNGDVTTIGEIVGGGGGSELPPHTIEDAGKVLGVDEEGSLDWEIIGGMKLYYKRFTDATGKSEIAGGLNRWKVQNISVEGYTPLFATCNDDFTGYWTMPTGIGYEYSSGTPDRVPSLGILTTYSGTTTSFASPITVYYAKNEDIEQLT